MSICGLIYGVTSIFKEAINSGFAISEFKKMSGEEYRDAKFFGGTGYPFEIKIATPKVKEAYVYLWVDFELGKNHNMPVYDGSVIVSQSKITNYIDDIQTGAAHEEYINSRRPDIVIKAINKCLKKIK